MRVGAWIALRSADGTSVSSPFEQEKLRKKKEEEEAMWGEYIEQRKKQRAKEEEELKKLKERQVGE